MSDPEHPQDQHSAPSNPNQVSLPRDEQFEEEVQRVTEELEAPKPDRPVAPSDLGSAEEVTLERERGTVRRDRVELEGLEESNKDLASALLSLSGSGGGSAFAWSTYVKVSTPAKPEPEPTGEGP